MRCRLLAHVGRGGKCRAFAVTALLRCERLFPFVALSGVYLSKCTLSRHALLAGQADVRIIAVRGRHSSK